MTTPQPALPNTSTCPRCGAGLRCGMVGGDATCWCAQLPPILPVPTGRASADGATAAASCFCPTCLEQIAHERLLDSPLHAAGH